MRDDIHLSDNIIRGECSLFVCRLCRTKYGWEHQRWCELGAIVEPSCWNCRYFRGQSGECVHPAPG